MFFEKKIVDVILASAYIILYKCTAEGFQKRLTE